MITETQIEARARIKLALRRIEAAQQLLDEACSDLSSVVGFVREWEHLCKTSEQVKSNWHRLHHCDDSAADLDSAASAGSVKL